MEILGNKKNEKNESFFCKKCDFNCRYISDWNRHITTRKHIVRSQEEINGNEWKGNSPSFTSQIKFTCENCNRIFQSSSGIWKHKQKCNKTIDCFKKCEEPTDKELITLLIKENSELKNMMMKVLENGTNNNNTNSNNTTNSHNKAFNLNFFLNETCKNAMNITDFVDSIKLQLNDLMSVGEIGFVEGISKIIVKNLNDLDETIRPVHCTDKKRETMYIKDEGEWQKDDDNKTKLKKTVNRVADKNIRLLPQFREKYPDYKDSSSKTSDIYDKMVVEVMKTDDDMKEKIIHNISKVTGISKRFQT